MKILKKTIEEMKEHEKEHCEFFENEIKKRNIQPTKFLPYGICWVLV
jgi:ubiquinone biosynthesis monooxygenase Coq7